MDGQKHNLGGQGELAQFMGGIDSIHYRHCDVSHNYIRTKTEGLQHQGCAVRSGSDYVELTLQKGGCRLQ
jgi:hypothetical protein